jgi:tetratricopeptide (TPR) repeat protein
MTDHRIGIYANPAALRAPRDERDPEIDDVLVTDGPRAPADAELYRVVAAVRAGSGDAARKLEQILAAAPPTAVEPYLDLAAAQLRQKHYGDAEKSARLVLSRAPDHPLALEILGLARGAQGARDEAIDLLRKSARLDPTRPEPHYDLALQLAARGDRADAAAELERAIALRPNFTAAWLQLGRVRKEREGKIEAYEHALAIDPRSRVATAGLTTLQR